jgi:excisionase family DNA binding protein
MEICFMERPPNFENLLRVSQAAKILNISKSQAYRLIRSGELPVIWIGKSMRISASALQKYLETQKTRFENDND